MKDGSETSGARDDETSRVRFGRVLDAFEQAWQRLILLSELFPTRLGRAASLCALALPRVVDTAETRLRPASKKEALLTMVRSSIFTMRPRGGRDAMEALTHLARTLPACWLDVGHDLEKIPPRIDEILAATAP